MCRCTSGTPAGSGGTTAGNTMGLTAGLGVVEEESFVPMALLLNGKVCSIVTDQLGTPTEAYNADGEEVWRRRLNMNGNYARFSSGHSFCFGG